MSSREWEGRNSKKQCLSSYSLTWKIHNPWMTRHWNSGNKQIDYIRQSMKLCILLLPVKRIAKKEVIFHLTTPIQIWPNDGLACQFILWFHAESKYVWLISSVCFKEIYFNNILILLLKNRSSSHHRLIWLSCATSLTSSIRVHKWSKILTDLFPYQWTQGQTEQIEDEVTFGVLNRCVKRSIGCWWYIIFPKKMIIKYRNQVS